MSPEPHEAESTSASAPPSMAFVILIGIAQGN